MNAKEISVAAQSALLEINRTGLYYKASQPSGEDLEIKKRTTSSIRITLNTDIDGSSGG